MGFHLTKKCLGDFYSQNGFTVENLPKYGRDHSVVENILKVHKQSKGEDKEDKEHVLTINLYRTKCLAMVNGKHLEVFQKEHLPQLEKNCQCYVQLLR